MRAHRSKSKARALLWPISSRAITCSAAEKSKTVSSCQRFSTSAIPAWVGDGDKEWDKDKDKGRGPGKALARDREHRIPIDRRGRAAETDSECGKIRLRTEPRSGLGIEPRPSRGSELGRGRRRSQGVPHPPAG